jgi:UDP-N-acetylmuramyl pentapeptide phosphotransferase/UDP-N-acetylglucosamine-1-phosphate transferase
VRVDLAALAMAFGVTLIAVWWLRRGKLALDEPNERSLHRVRIPRSGGLGVHAGVIAAWVYTGVPWTWIVLIAYIALLALSLVDDIRGLPALARFAAHILAATWVVHALLIQQADWLVITLVTLATAWSINLYNFMDGADGLAGGMAVSGFFFYGLAGSADGLTPFAMLNFCIAASALAFLAFNFPPASIFLGDAGSIPLGFLAAVMGLIGWQHQFWPWWYPAAVFAPFVVDATLTLARRLAEGKRVWEAHREHAYQKLVLLGWGHRRTTLHAYGLMLACGVLAFVSRRAGEPLQWLALALITGVCVAVVILAERAWRRRSAERCT